MSRRAPARRRVTQELAASLFSLVVGCDATSHRAGPPSAAAPRTSATLVKAPPTPTPTVSAGPQTSTTAPAVVVPLAQAMYYRSVRVGLMPYGSRVTWALSLDERRMTVLCETALDGLSLHPDQHTPDTWHERVAIDFDLVKRTDIPGKRLALSFKARGRAVSPPPIEPAEARRPILCDELGDTLKLACETRRVKFRSSGAWVLEGQKANYGVPVRWSNEKLQARSGWGCALESPEGGNESTLASFFPGPNHLGAQLFFAGQQRDEGVELVDQKDGELEARAYRAWTMDVGTGKFRYRYGSGR